MPNYKLAVSKDGKRYSIVFKADNEILAKERVHREGYSILGIEQIAENSVIGNTFIFEGRKLGELKHGKIVGDDIFKAYKKLRKDLEYEVLYIYSEKDKGTITEEKKEAIVKELQEEYELYYSTGKKEKIDELRDSLNKEREERKKIDSFFLKKELETVNKLMDSVMVKLDDIIRGKSPIKPSIGQKEKFKSLYNSIIRLRKSTNISKLKQVGEQALVKLGELELREVEKTKDENSRRLLGNTNALLRKLGSKDQFIEKDKDIMYQLNKIWSNFTDSIGKVFRKQEQQIEEIDKDSHSYIKTKLYLNKYRKRNKENISNIFQNFGKFVTNKKFREETLLKRNVIHQNITLLRAKLKGKIHSYTFVKKGFSKIIDDFLQLFEVLREYLFILIAIYTIFFIIYLNVNLFLGVPDYNNFGLFIFILLVVLYFLLYLTRELIFFPIIFVFLFIIVIFGVINF